MGGVVDEVQKFGGYFVELQKDGAQVHGVDHNTRAGTSTFSGPKGNKYHYSKDIPFSQFAGWERGWQLYDLGQRRQR